MTCARCPSPSPVTVEQAGVELCRVCADLGAEKTNAPDGSEAVGDGFRRNTTGFADRPYSTPARPARSKR